MKHFPGKIAQSPPNDKKILNKKPAKPSFSKEKNKTQLHFSFAGKYILVQFFKQTFKTHFICDDSMQVINFYALLFHAVAVADGNGIVF